MNVSVPVASTRSDWATVGDAPETSSSVTRTQSRSDVPAPQAVVWTWIVGSAARFGAGRQSKRAGAGDVAAKAAVPSPLLGPRLAAVGPDPGPLAGPAAGPAEQTICSIRHPRSVGCTANRRFDGQSVLGHGLDEQTICSGRSGGRSGGRSVVHRRRGCVVRPCRARPQARAPRRPTCFGCRTRGVGNRRRCRGAPGARLSRGLGAPRLVRPRDRPAPHASACAAARRVP